MLVHGSSFAFVFQMPRSISSTKHTSEKWQKGESDATQLTRKRLLHSAGFRLQLTVISLLPVKILCGVKVLCFRNESCLGITSFFLESWRPFLSRSSSSQQFKIGVPFLLLVSMGLI